MNYPVQFGSVTLAELQAANGNLAISYPKKGKPNLSAGDNIYVVTGVSPTHAQYGKNRILHDVTVDQFKVQPDGRTAVRKKTGLLRPLSFDTRHGRNLNTKVTSWTPLSGLFQSEDGQTLDIKV